MSTFKIQPTYAELLLGWLDAARLGVADMNPNVILSRVLWNFKGGKLGDYPMAFPTDCSEVRFPSGSAQSLSALTEDNVERAALEALTTRRIRDGRKRARGCADWAASWALANATLVDATSSHLLETGLRAVYRVLMDVWENCEVQPRSKDMANMRSFIRETTLASSAASLLDVPTTEEVVSATFSALSFTRIAALRQATAEFTRAMRYSGSRDARSHAVRVGRDLIADVANRAGASARELGGAQFEIAGRSYTIGHGIMTSIVRGRAVALSRSDIARVYQFLVGAQSGLFATVTQACVAPGPERDRAVEIGRIYEAQVSRILEPACSIPAGDEVYICKAYKRAFGAYLGELSGPLCAAETVELWSETHETKHAAKLSLDAWVGAIRPWSASTAFNLGKVYKLCPAPDASPGLTLIERHEMVCNHNSFDPKMSEVFRSELRAQILRAYIRAPGVRLELRDKASRPTWWAAYKAGRFDEVPSDDIHTWLKWEETATMPVRSPDNPAVWKDSGLGWDNYDTAIDPERTRTSGNMLMRMVFDSSAPMPGVRHWGHAHDHKIDIKPEGHKDPARGIYSGNLCDRLNQSWMEAAVQEVACKHPAFMIGADVELRDARVRAVVERSHDVSMVTLYYSFDVSGWSPRMPPEPQIISHAVWGDLYNEPLFRAAQGIIDGARIYMNKGGYTGWYLNPGANLEGYNGKEMTMILIVLMSLSVKEWRRRVIRAKIATEAEARSWSAILLAYIDDGLAKLTLPRDRAVALFECFKESSVDTFAACGYSIEKSKCYPSDRFAIFLNEPYLAGRHVTHGTRAAMTICAENTEEHTSLVERLTAVSTGCRGAVMAGLDATAGIMLQGYHVYAHMSEWVRRPDPVVAAVWYVAPRAWGGLGMPTALQLGTSGSGSAFEESVRTLQKWAQISTPARLVFLKKARGKLVERTAAGVLMAPLGGRTGDGTLVETRVPDAVRTALASLRMRGRISMLAGDFLNFSSPQSLEAFSAAVVPLRPGSVIQEQVLSDLASAHPHAIFSAFARRIEKSNTLMQLIGAREVRRIIKANRLDASLSYSSLRSVLMF